jgi:hypothetical protein
MLSKLNMMFDGTKAGVNTYYCRESNKDTSIVQSVVRRYSNYAVPVPCGMCA